MLVAGADYNSGIPWLATLVSYVLGYPLAMHDMSVAHTTEVRQTWQRELPDGAGRLARMCTRSRPSLAYHSATWPPPTQLDPPFPNLVFTAQLP
ncbi:hypothetical protein HaLaN_17459, partial [Haematococcus lacustris]